MIRSKVLIVASFLSALTTPHALIAQNYIATEIFLPQSDGIASFDDVHAYLNDNFYDLGTPSGTYRKLDSADITTLIEGIVSQGGQITITSVADPKNPFANRAKACENQKTETKNEWLVSTGRVLDRQLLAFKYDEGSLSTYDVISSDTISGYKKREALAPLNTARMTPNA